jgi:hypothetical protein
MLLCLLVVPPRVVLVCAVGVCVWRAVDAGCFLTVAVGSISAVIVGRLAVSSVDQG